MRGKLNCTLCTKQKVEVFSTQSLGHLQPKCKFRGAHFCWTHGHILKCLILLVPYCIPLIHGFKDYHCNLSFLSVRCFFKLTILRTCVVKTYIWNSVKSLVSLKTESHVALCLHQSTVQLKFSQERSSCQRLWLEQPTLQRWPHFTQEKYFWLGLIILSSVLPSNFQYQLKLSDLLVSLTFFYSNR